MGKFLSSFLKRPEQPNSKYIIVGSTKENLYKKTHIFITKIIPNRIIMEKNVYEITFLDELYHLDGFEIDTENDKVFNVRVFGFHPNCDPETNIFCIPDFKKGCVITNEYIDAIITNIHTYYLDNCYYNPLGKHLQYRKLKSIYIQMNK